MFEFFDYVYGFLTSGIYALIKDAFSWMIQKAFIAYYESMLWSLEFAWEISSGIIAELDLSNQIMAAFNGLPSASKQVMVFFRLPEFINLILSAYTTRLVLKFVPFL